MSADNVEEKMTVMRALSQKCTWVHLLERFFGVLIVVALCAAACGEDVDYDPKSSSPTLCFEGDSDCSGTRPCRADTECPAGYRCTVDGLCTDRPEGDCVDADDDGYGDNCTLGRDCDDGDFFRNSGVTEVCNNIDDNCDGFVDENGICDGCEDECELGAQVCIDRDSYHRCEVVSGCALWLPPFNCQAGCFDGQCLDPCQDSDGDGFGDGCASGPDCDDRNPLSFPNNPEVCDGYDNNCAGGVDEGGVCHMECPPSDCARGEQRCLDATTRQICTINDAGCVGWFSTLACAPGETCEGGLCVGAPQVCTIDTDSDGYGVDCPMGLDCDDFDRDTNPAGVELCDGKDNDCDGSMDEGLAGCAATYCGGPTPAPSFEPELYAYATGYGYTCPEREDFHRISGTLEGGDTIVVKAWQPLDSAPVALSLYRLEVQGESRVFIDSVPPDPFGATFTLPGDGQYVVGVRSTQATSHSYAVSWQKAFTSFCGTDVWEVNNSPGRATPILPNTTRSGSLCRNDLDFYQLEGFGPDDIVYADVTYAGDPIIFEIWRGGEILTPDQSRGQGRRHAHFRGGDAAAEYSVVVRSLSAGNVADYVLSVGTWSRACQEDGLESSGGEENDALSSATNIDGVGMVTGTLCPGDLDFYDIGTYPRGGQVDVSVEFDSNAANLDAYLFHENINGLFQIAVSDGSPENLPTNISQAGRYYVLVIGRTSRDSADYQIITR